MYEYSTSENNSYHLKNFASTFSFNDTSAYYNNYSPFINFFGNDMRYIFKKFIKQSYQLTSYQGCRLEVLSERFYGTTSLWWVIHACSPDVLNPFVIPVGTNIYIPRKEEVDNFVDFINNLNDKNGTQTTNNVLKF